MFINQAFPVITFLAIFCGIQHEHPYFESISNPKLRYILKKAVKLYVAILYLYILAIKIDFIWETIQTHVTDIDGFVTAAVAVLTNIQDVGLRAYCLIKSKLISKLEKCFLEHKTQSKHKCLTTFAALYALSILSTVINLVLIMQGNARLIQANDSTTFGQRTIPRNEWLITIVFYGHKVFYVFTDWFAQLLLLHITSRVFEVMENFFVNFELESSVSKHDAFFKVPNNFNHHGTNQNCLDDKLNRIKALYKAFGDLFGIYLLFTIPRYIVDAVIQFYKALTVYELDIIYTPEEAFLDALILVARIFIPANCGYILHTQLIKWKFKLKYRLTLLSDGTGFYFDDAGKSTTILCRVKSCINWNWRLSACGYFIVDRGLMSRITAAILTYLIVLLQFHISEKSGHGNSHNRTMA